MGNANKIGAQPRPPDPSLIELRAVELPRAYFRPGISVADTLQSLGSLPC